MMYTRTHDSNNHRSSSCIVCQNPVRYICPCLQRHFCSLQCQTQDWNEGNHYATCAYGDQAQGNISQRSANVEPRSDTTHPVTNTSSKFQRPERSTYPSQADGTVILRTESASNSVSAYSMQSGREENRSQHGPHQYYNASAHKRTDTYKWPRNHTAKPCSCAVHPTYPKTEVTNDSYQGQPNPQQHSHQINQFMSHNTVVQSAPYQVDKSCCKGHNSKPSKQYEKPRTDRADNSQMGCSKKKVSRVYDAQTNGEQDNITEKLPPGYEREAKKTPDSLPPGYELYSAQKQKKQRQRPSYEGELPSSESDNFQSAQSEPQSSSSTKKLRVCTWKGCDKSFLRSDHYNRHLNTHTGYKPYNCTWKGCGKSFSQANNLSRHTKTHTKERPYVCTWEGCGQRFSEGSNLARHYRLHSGKRPFICTWEGCQKAFADPSYRTAHEKTHSRSEVFTCTVQGCDRTFSTHGYLKRHVKSHNADNSNSSAQ